MYQLLKRILFLHDPEKVHDLFIFFGEFLGSLTIARTTVGYFCRYSHPALRTKVLGIDFENPVGLAAGFDKDVRLMNIMPSVGFGFMEVGAITRHPYEGNPGLRLLRLPKDKALIVYYGLKNIGAESVLKKIDKLHSSIPVGINIAKTNRADIKGDKSVEDYVGTYRMLGSYFDYVTLNISCPNTQDGCTFQDPNLLGQLLNAIDKEVKNKPVFLKISNHLSTEEVDDILGVVKKYKCVDGFVIANLSKRRDIINLKSSPELLNKLPQGGISGMPIQGISTDLIRYIYKKTGGKYVLVGLGGIFTAEDAYAKIKAGASLVQLITGLIYGGPMTIKRINQGLVRLLEKDGYKNISEAIGRDFNP